MGALEKELSVHVVGTALLALQGPKNGVNATKDSAPRGSIASEGIHARTVRLGAVRAPGAEPKPKDVPEGQAHQDLETMGTGQGVAR